MTVDDRKDHLCPAGVTQEIESPLDDVSTGIVLTATLTAKTYL